MVTIRPLSVDADPGEKVTFSCSATGLAATSFTYHWLLNGAPVRRETKQTLVITASEDKTGNYQCTVRNEYGSFGKSSVARLTLSKQTTSFCYFTTHTVLFIPKDRFCSPVTVNYSGFNVTWNETLVGVTVEAPCTGPGLNGKHQEYILVLLAINHSFMFKICSSQQIPLPNQY